MDIFQQLVSAWTPAGSTNNSSSNSSKSVTPSSSEIESYILSGVNKRRQELSLRFVAMDAELSKLALAHSRWMNQTGITSHAGWEDWRSQNVQKLGYKTAGENLAGGECYDYELSEQLQLLVPRWIGSPGHRKVIETASFTHTGIGFVVSRFNDQEDRLAYFVTQIFAG